MTRAFTGSFGAILAINGHFLAAFAAASAAWLVWPQSPEWWAFGVLSVLLGLAATSAFAKAVRAILKLHTRLRAVAAFEALGPAPRSSQMASREALVRMGMIDE